MLETFSSRLVLTVSVSAAATMPPLPWANSAKLYVVPAASPRTVYWVVAGFVVATAWPEVTLRGAVDPVARRIVTPASDLLAGFVQASVRLCGVAVSRPAAVTRPGGAT